MLRRRIYQRALTVVFAALVVALHASPARAQCGCVETATCGGFHESDFVFTARVTAIRYLEPVVVPGEPPLEPTEGVATLAVAEVFRGVVPPVVDVPMGGECEVSFSVGEQYLVYGASVTYGADGRVQQIFASGCSRTRPLSEAADDLAVIRALAGGKADASLHGYISPYDVISAIFDDAPVYDLTLEGGGRRYQSETRGGKYEFNFLNPGRYQLTITRGKDFEVRLSARLEPQACFDAGMIRMP